MIRGITAGAAALLLSACASVQSVPSNPPPPSLDAVETALARDITTLSDDGFGGRFPGSEGEAKTQRWLIDRYAQIGLQPGAGEGEEEYQAEHGESRRHGRAGPPKHVLHFKFSAGKV